MTWQIDNNDTLVEFKVKKLWGLITVRGKMATRQVRLEMEGANPENWSIYAEIDPASINTGNARRDKHLQTADFFDTGRYPSIVFRSTGLTQFDENKLKLNGELTIKDISRQVVLEVIRKNEIRNGIEFAATTIIQRGDFGLNFSRLPIGPEVEVNLELRTFQRVKPGSLATSR